MTIQLLPPEPLNLATRGYYGGVYGLATRGYLSFPDVVSRFPIEGTVQYDELIGLVKDEIWDSIINSVDMKAHLAESSDLQAILQDIVWRAKVDQIDFGEGIVTLENQLNIIVDPQKLMEAILVDIGLKASLFDGGLQAEITDEDQSSVLVERPGEGRCKE
jgi:hypothetical protein